MGQTILVREGLENEFRGAGLMPSALQGFIKTQCIYVIWWAVGFRLHGGLGDQSGGNLVGERRKWDILA